jgi:hypothetical protein
VLEQRVVDAIAAHRHQEINGWRSRGLGASVNATNISQRKVGDCDFQSSQQLKVNAYEAHGGTLSTIYVKEHLRTVGKTMPIRVEELSGIADLTKWEISITFIAHVVAAGPIEDIKMSGVKVKVGFESYQEFVRRAIAEGIPSSLLNTLILSPLREARTPSDVRKVLNQAIA